MIKKIHFVMIALIFTVTFVVTSCASNEQIVPALQGGTNTQTATTEPGDEIPGAYTFAQEYGMFLGWVNDDDKLSPVSQLEDSELTWISQSDYKDEIIVLEATKFANDDYIVFFDTEMFKTNPDAWEGIIMSATNESEKIGAKVYPDDSGGMYIVMSKDDDSAKTILGSINNAIMGYSVGDK